jgi:hypothetical protein
VFKKAINTDANTGSGTSNGTVFLLDTTMPYGTDKITVSTYYEKIIYFHFKSEQIPIYLSTELVVGICSDSVSTGHRSLLK